jgi:hypothetical protein
VEFRSLERLHDDGPDVDGRKGPLLLFRGGMIELMAAARNVLADRRARQNGKLHGAPLERLDLPRHSRLWFQTLEAEDLQ